MRWSPCERRCGGGCSTPWASPQPPTSQSLADRVAQLCSALLSASLDGPARAVPAPPTAAHDAGEPTGAAPARAAMPARQGSGAIVDERDEDFQAPAAASAIAPLARARAAHGARHSATADGGEIAVRDERAGEPGAAPWIAAISRRLRGFELDRRPFAVLLLELRELDRLRAALAPHQLDRLSAEVEQAIAELLAGEGEEPIAQGQGRYWLIAPARDAAAAGELARRIGDALPGRVGAGASVLVGIAVCPVHARSAAGLAAHADVDLYAARTAEGSRLGVLARQRG